jgi:hypothetical protein
MNRQLTLVLAAAFGLAACSHVPARPATSATSDRSTEPGAKTPSDSNPLQSTDLDTLAAQTGSAASGSNRKAIESLASQLADPAFLDRLDPPGSDPGNYAQLRLASVLRKLSINKTPSAAEALLALTTAPAFQKKALRIQVLIHALTPLQPPPQRALAYWNRFSNPQSPVLYDVVESLLVNQSDDALALFQKLVADPKQSFDQKAAWFHNLILPHRYEEALLSTCESLLKRKEIGQETQTVILESLFDYKPDEWYSGDDPPKPPKLESASLKSKDLLRSIATDALTRNLTDLQKAPITATLQTLKGK